MNEIIAKGRAILLAIVICVTEAFGLMLRRCRSSASEGNGAMKSVSALAFVSLIFSVSSAGAVSCADGKEKLVEQLSPLIKDYTGAYLKTPADKFDDKFAIDYFDFYSDNVPESENVKECIATIKIEEVGGGAWVKQDVRYRIITTEDGNVLIKINGNVNFASRE